MNIWRRTAISLVILSSAGFAQSPLDVPGDKKITVGSEIARGASEISSEATKRDDISLVYLEGHLADVIIANKSRQTDSDGFMLGARVQELVMLNLLLHLDGMRQFNTQEDIANAISDAKEDVRNIRALQKKLGVDDAMLIAALGVTTSEGTSMIKALITSYEN